MPDRWPTKEARRTTKDVTTSDRSGARLVGTSSTPAMLKLPPKSARTCSLFQDIVLLSTSVPASWNLLLFVLSSGALWQHFLKDLFLQHAVKGAVGTLQLERLREGAHS